jgi:hypothetical protein
VWPRACCLIKRQGLQPIADPLDLVRIQRDLQVGNLSGLWIFASLRRVLTILGTDHWKVKPFCPGCIIAVSEHRMIPVLRCFSDSKTGSSDLSQCNTDDPGKCLEQSRLYQNGDIRKARVRYSPSTLNHIYSILQWRIIMKPFDFPLLNIRETLEPSLIRFSDEEWDA